MMDWKDKADVILAVVIICAMIVFIILKFKREL